MTPREKIIGLIKGKPFDEQPLFFPLVHALGAKIEEIDQSEFLTNPTKLTKGLKELSEALESDAIVCCCGAAMEAEGAGAQVSWDTYPPKVTGHLPAGGLGDELIAKALASPRIVAAVESTRRLAAVEHELVLIACVTGPMTLAGQLRGGNFVDSAEDGEDAPWVTLDFAGRLNVAVAKEFLQAGAHVLLVLEEDALPPVESPVFAEWKSAINPLANIARFHQALPVILPTGQPPGYDSKGLLNQLPQTLSVCLPLDHWQSGRSHQRVVGAALPLDMDWRPDAIGNSYITVTAGELPPSLNVKELRRACLGWRSSMSV